jgi:hypothetical protein
VQKLLVDVTGVDGLPTKQLVGPGDTIRLAPHCDLWMQGAASARVLSISTGTLTLLRVRPFVMGYEVAKTYSIHAHHILANR